MNNPTSTQLDPSSVLAYIERRFPREYEIALQAVYIHALEEAAAVSQEEPNSPDD